MTTGKWLALFAVIGLMLGGLTACAGTTPVGALGAPTDLRPLLPAEVAKRAPADNDALRANTRVAVGKPAATVQITWRYFKDGARGYLLNVAFSVTEAAEGLELTAAPEGAPVYVGVSDRATQAQRIVINWSRRSTLGTEVGAVTGLILADGRWEPAQ